MNLNSLVINEVKLIGSRCGPFRPAIELLQHDQIEVEPLIEAKFPIEQGVTAVEYAQATGSLKVLLEFD